MIDAPLSPALVWFRQDLRLSDNPALQAAVARGGPVIPVFIWAPEEEDSWVPGAASRWWLHRSLGSLGGEFAKRGSRLVIRTGRPAAVLAALAAETGASAVFWNRRYEPAAVTQEQGLTAMLVERGLTAQSFDGNLLFDPTLVRNQSGQPFRVFTAYWRSCMNRPVAAAKKAPRTLPAPETWPASLDVADLGLDPAADWTHGFCVTWRPGEAGAQEQLKRFRKASLEKYSTGRDRPGTGGTSRLSPHLRFGEISPRAIWHATVSLPGGDAYVRQLAWREFAHYLLLHHPGSPDEPLRPAFESFPWKGDLRTLEAWQQGLTGYPLVDAGMRELWRTGWMHNRVRMVAASFLVKHLLIDWRDGAVWFWDTLVDASLANNTMSWQWVAGCGADAAPYFRIFNPVMQGEKFDPAGEYIRRWVPELAGLSKEWIHKPWKAPASVLRTAGVKLGKSYPRPIIDHDEARRRALTALSTIKGS